MRAVSPESDATKIRPAARPERLRKTRLRRLALEGLEARELLASVPAPQLDPVNAGRALFNPPGLGGVAAPSIAIDPAHPNRMAAVWMRNDPANPGVAASPSNNAVPVFVQGAYSTDGGLTWSTLNDPLDRRTLDFTVSPNPDANGLSTYFTSVTNPSVSFDGHDNLYIADVPRKPDNSVGEVVLHRFSFGAGGPGGSAATTVLTAWNTGATPASYPVFGVTVAADGNLASFTDGAQTQTDPAASFVSGGQTFGGVYVAWTTTQVTGIGQAARVQLVASGDGGATFTGARSVSSGFPEIASAPSLAVSQGKPGAVAGGQINLVWDDSGTNANNTPPSDRIMYASASFNGTTLTSTGEKQIASTYVRGTTNAAAASNPFPNAGATAVSPLGIGPAPVIVSDNTLGAFSPFEGRLYVAYVNNIDVNGNPGTPADNTDIYLTSSADGGASFGGQTRVNDDNAQTDGFSEGQALGNSGRPQFEPSLAVDPTTGALAVSYLDARNDAARARTATYVNVSIDGGATFSPGNYANKSKTTTDAITGQAVNLGPVPDNQSAGNVASRDTTYGFGDHQGLAFYHGVILPIWASNSNGGGDGGTGWTAFVARMDTAAGPRVLSGTMGVVGEPGDPVNSARNAAGDGGPEAGAFVITLDRPIDPNSVNVNDVTITYEDPNGVRSSIVPTGVTALNANAIGATRFRIDFPPDARIGTYSYAIAANGANDLSTRIRYVTSVGALAQTESLDQNANAVNAAAGDVFAVPTTSDTLPLIVPGPHLQSVSIAGASVVDGIVTELNAPVAAVTVKFDRKMAPFTGAQVVRVMGPAGQINGPFTVAQVPGDATSYVITFAAGQVPYLSGTYTVTLASTITDTGGHPLDSNLNAGLYVLRGAEPSAQVTSKSYASTDPQLAIPDATAGAPVVPGKVVSKIFVPDNNLIQGLSVALDITHPNDPDLKVTLVGPDGVVLSNGTIVSGTNDVLFANIGVGAAPADFTGTILDDTTRPNNPITLSGAPFTGKFNPQHSLGNAFVNGSLKSGGFWYLVVEDDNPGNAGTLNSWSLTLQSKVPGTGLGEPVADQASFGFRIFNDNPAVAASTQQWTSVGPGPITTLHQPPGVTAFKSGRIGAIAVDASDPSGNTVYVGGASGGVWKTTNFLTTAAAGPTWIPLTDFGPNSQINVGTITVVPQLNAQKVYDPTKSIVLVGLGDGDTKTKGTGFLRSTDGGATFVAIQDSGPASGRVSFVTNNTYVWKIAVDPNVNTVIYAAVGGSGNTAGLWRSVDGGDNWNLMKGGQATDVTLDQISSTGIAGGNLQIVYAAFPGDGVYSSPNQGQSWFPMLGNTGDPLIQDVNRGQVGVAGSPGAPAGTSDGRILLAKPALQQTTDPTRPGLQDQIYKGWLFALVGTGAGLDGLYVTKDFGQNWTKVVLPMSVSAFGTFPSNDPTRPGYDPTGGRAGYDLSFAADPTNPNVVYIGGGGGGSNPGFLRVDLTAIYDAHNFVPKSDNSPDGGTLTVTSSGPLSLDYAQNQPSYLIDPNSGQPVPASYLNLIRDPNAPFNVNATVKTQNVTQFNNTGANAKVFTYLSADTRVESADTALNYSHNQHRLVTYVDPTTGRARLIIGDDQGLYTGVDNNGTFVGGVATATGATGPVGTRNGNLALTQFYYGAVQPSTHNTFTGNAMPVLFYGGVNDEGAPVSSGLLATGGTTWTSPASYDGSSLGVATDQTGTGTVYRFIPFGQAGTNFFQVRNNGSGGFISRTFGLTTGPNDTQWNSGPTFNNGLTAFGNFAVNPLSPDQIVISSNNGTVYRTEDRGQTWQVIAGPLADAVYSPALAFGAPDPGFPAGVNNLDNFIYAGTLDGRIFVTSTGGGGAGNAWAEISGGLDGSTVQRIVTNPKTASHEAYAITLKGVYRVSDSLANGATWQNVTGNLTAANFPKLTGLTALQADWRYQVPDSAANPTGPTHPALYVSGDVGVYRSLDAGKSWQLFPSMSGVLDAAPADGGYLPDTRVADLDLASGNVNPATGRSTWAAGDPSLLVASTWGRGQFTIQLAPDVINNPTPRQASYIALDPSSLYGNTNDGHQVTTYKTPIVINGYSEQSANGNTVTLQAFDITDPANPRPLTLTGSRLTDGSGRYKLTIPLGQFPNVPATGQVVTVGIQATDQTGAKGNLAPFEFVIEPNPTPIPVSLALDPASDSGTFQNDAYTHDNNSANHPAPVFDVSGVIAPPPGLLTTVVLVRATQSNGVVGPYSVVNTVTTATAGTVKIADLNGGNGPIPDTVILGNATDSPPVQPNQYVYSAYQIDAITLQSGNYATPVPVIIDTRSPTTPTKIALQGASDSGTSNGDSYTFFNNGSHAAPVFDISGIEPHATVILQRALDLNGVIGAFVSVNTLVNTAGGVVSIADINGGNGPIPDNPVGNPSDTAPPVGNPYIYKAFQIDLAGNISRDQGFGNTGAVVIDGTDSDDHGTNTNGALPNAGGWIYMEKVLPLISPNVTNNNRVIVALGADPDPAVKSFGAAAAIESAFLAGPLPAAGWSVVYVHTPADMQTYLSGGTAPAFDSNNAPVAGGMSLDKTGILYVTTVDQAVADMDDNELAVLNKHGQDVFDFVNGGGGLFAQAESPFVFTGPTTAWVWLENIFPGLNAVDLGGGGNGPNALVITPEGQQAFPGLLPTDLSTGPWHNYFEGNLGALVPAVTDLDDTGVRRNLILTSIGIKLAPIQVTIDSTAPATSTTTLDAASDSGTYNNDKVTNKNNSPSPSNAPVFDVDNVEPNGIVKLYRATYNPNTGVVGPALLVNTITQVPSVPVGTIQIADLNGGAKIPDGYYVYTTQQTDLAGNVGAFSLNLVVQVDATAPVAPNPLKLDPTTDSGTFNNDLVTDFNNGNPYPAPLFDVGTVEAHATLQLFRAPVVNGVAGPSVLVDTLKDVAGGPMSIADTNAGKGVIPDGTYNYTAMQTDLAGNPGPLTGVLTVVINTAVPNPAPPPPPDLEAASDTGTFNNDNVTQADNGPLYPAPIFDVGTAGQPVDKAATVQLFRAALVNGVAGPAVLVNTLKNTAGGVVAIADVNAGNGVIPDGTYNYTAQLTSLAGVAGAMSAPLRVFIVANPPAVPSPFRLDANSDTGVSNSDGVTQITLFRHPVFDAGGVLKGATLNLFRAPVDNLGNVGAAALITSLSNTAGGLVQISDLSVIPDGTYVYTVQQIDLNGNSSPVGGAITVVYDTQQPNTPGKPALDRASDTGVVGDNITSNTSPVIDVPTVISGLETRSSLKLVRDGAVVNQSAYTLTGGTVSIQDPGPVSFGSHVYQAYLTDLAGNVSPLGAPLAVTFANDAAGTILLDPTTDSGVKGDNITNASQPVFDVIGVQANATLRLIRGGLTVATTATGAGGTVKITDPGLLVSGNYAYTTQTVDSNGNISPNGPGLTLTVDQNVPVAPTQFKLDAASDSGAKGDNLTNSTAPGFDASSVVAGATLNLYRDGAVVGTLTSAAGGTVLITDGGPAPAGPHVYTLKQVSPAGNTSPAAAPLTVTIDTTTPAGPTLALDPASDSGTKGDGITNVTSPTLDAAGVVAGSSLTLYRNGLSVRTLLNVAGGTVKIQDPGPLADGIYTYSAQQTSPAGNTSPFGASITVTINTIAPAVPTAPVLGLDPATDSGLKGDNTTSNRRLTIGGSADPGVVVTLFDGTGKTVGTASTDTLGNFRFPLAVDLPDGVYTYTAQATDSKNAKSAVSTPLKVSVVTVGGDYNGDGKTDVTIFRRTGPNVMQWFSQGTAALNGRSFGAGSLDVPLYGDFDGDGKVDLALYRPSSAQWFVEESSTNYVGQLLTTFGWANHDVPVPANYGGPGTTNVAVFRPSTGQWFFYGVANPTAPLTAPQAGDVPVPADYAGNGSDQLAVFRPSTHTWYIQGPSGAVTTVSLGASAGDVPVPGAYDATAASHGAVPAVFSPATGLWTIKTATGTGTRTVQFAPNDVPMPGDYDGLGVTEPAVYRPGTAQWFVQGPNDNAPRQIASFGWANHDVPTVSPYRYRALALGAGGTGVAGGITASSLSTSGTGGGLDFGAGALGLATATVVVTPPAPGASAPAAAVPPQSHPAAHARPARHLHVQMHQNPNAKHSSHTTDLALAALNGAKTRRYPAPRH